MGAPADGGGARVLLDDPDIKWGDGMQFRLTYSGPLLGASRSDTRARHKHDIRRAFHGQLKLLWETHVELQHHVNQPASLYGSPAWLAGQFGRNGHRFVPLVFKSGFLYARVDVLMLRLGTKQDIVQDGDLDGRLKTIFDALRMPRSAEELAGATPSEGEDPFYVLLEDDNLITRASIESDYLLEPVEGCESQHQSRVVITVEVKQSLLRPGNYGAA